MDKLEKSIKDISNNYYDYLTSLQNVNGVGYGYKYVNDKNTFEPCIHVLVEDKIDKKYISKNNLVPKSYMGIKTDVRAIGKIELTNKYIKTRPLKAGASIGVGDHGFIGTMCCIVKKKRKISFKKYEYDYYILSNNHVISENGTIPKGSLVVQPSIKTELTYSANIIATVDTFIPIKRVKGILRFSNFVDCALAKIINKSFISNKILGLSKINGITKPKLGMIVNKTGNTTGIKQGKITTLHTTHIFKPPSFFKDKKVIFIEQIDIDMLSLPGDSGAPILTVDSKLVGLNMAGNSKNLAVANDINNVFFYLKVEPYLGEDI